MPKHKTLVEQFYNHIAPEYHHQRYVSENTISSYGMLKRRNVVEQLMDSIDTNGKKLLDVGCGSGSYASAFILRGYEVWGIDISSKMIEHANRLLIEESLIQRAHFSQGDVEDLSLPSNFFDVVVATGVLEYLKADDKAIKEIFRVTKPNGMVIISLNNRQSYRNFLRAVTLVPIKKLTSPYFPDRVSCSEFTTRPHSPKEFINYMNSCGFSFVRGEFCGFSIIPCNLRMPKAYFYFSELLERSLKSVGLDVIFGAYVGVFRKRPK